MSCQMKIVPKIQYGKGPERHFKPLLTRASNPPQCATTQRNETQTSCKCSKPRQTQSRKSEWQFAAQLHSTISKGAYIAMASLAWNLKCWLALSLKESGTPKQKAELRVAKHRLLRMSFSTFLQTSFFDWESPSGAHFSLLQTHQSGTTSANCELQ